MQIKFGTDGWRAIIADDYTVENVKRVSEATAAYLLSIGKNKVVIGHDCRFGGELFAATAAGIFGANGIKVFLARDFVSTPMVSLGVVKNSADLGIVITASHNPPSYNGYKLKSHFGGPSSPDEISKVESLIPEVSSTTPLSLDEMQEKGLLEYTPLEDMYVNWVIKNFDMQLIKQSGIKLAYDAMYGAGMRAVSRLFPEAVLLHCTYNPSFEGQAPEPIDKNLQLLAQTLRNDPTLSLGLANDGDADRIGLYDEDGQFVDSHHILLLLLHYLTKYKQETGKVVITFSVTDKMIKLAQKLNLPYEVTKIGFKYIADIMTKEDVIVGGEESGGLAVKGHIPERDGIWIGLMVMEFMAKTGKSLKALIQEVYDEVGSFWCERADLHITEEQKQKVINHCKNGDYKSFGDYTVHSSEDMDGYKYHLSDDSWTMIRPSGTEPVLRIYSQAPDIQSAKHIIEAVVTTIS